MSSSFRPARALLAAALALAAAPALAQGPYTRTVFFGDSLTDAGYFRPLLPADVRAMVGQFTNNPGWVWSQYLADYYGTNYTPNGNGQTGDNYAAGGARVGVDVTNPLNAALPPVPSLKSQVNAYLAANGGKADAGALYTVWGGANDLFAVQANPAQAQAIIGAAVTDQIGIVGTLKGAGAQYILVPTIPDIGLTPASRAGGAVAMAQGTALAKSYNTALFAGLKQAGLQVIPVDTFTVLQELVANPGAFGFANVSGTACTGSSSLTCAPTALVSPNAGSTYLFADGVHPTSAAHAILGDYAVSILEGPRLQQVLTQSATVIGRARAEQVSLHLEGPQHDGMSWWGNLRADMQRHDHANLFDGAAPAGLFGIDWVRDGVVLGGFAGFGRMKGDFGNSGGDFKHTDSTLGLFAGWYGQHAFVNAQLSHSWLDFDVNRQVNLGPAKRIHSGSPEGSNRTAALNAGYEFGREGGFRHGPVAGVVWQKTKLDGYEESNRSATALGYADQEVDSTVGRLGWQARWDAGRVHPYIHATYDHEFEEGHQASAWLQTMADVGQYKVPGLHHDKDYATVVLGARFSLWGLHSNIGVSTVAGQNDVAESTLFASFSGSF